MNVSFSAEVKAEALAFGAELRPCCEAAQNSALLLFARDFSVSRLSLLTENPAVAEAYAAAVRFFSGVSPEIMETEGGNYKIDIADRRTAQAVVEEVSASDAGGKKRIRFEALREQCCRMSYLRGAFLVCGTVTDPAKEYHLEFSCPSKGLAEDLAALIDGFGLAPKTINRNGTWLVYLKDSEVIADLLSTIGATDHAMELMHAKVVKDIRNTVNRKVNFENANMERSAQAAVRQYKAISLIRDTRGLDSLPENLRAIALLRLRNREVGTAEITKMLPEPLTISGANHRFQRLLKIAAEEEEKLAQQDEKEEEG